jgi:hypothetical protein
VRARFMTSTPGTSIPRLFAILAASILVSGMLMLGASRAPVVLGSAVALASFSFDTIGTQTAGQAFTITVTALDRRGRVVRTHSGGELSGLAASPSGAAPTYGALTWVDGVGTASVTATRSQAGASLWIDFGDINGTSNTFPVLPGVAAALHFADPRNGFNGQPVDTKFDAKISSSLAVQAPVKVLATDALGNRVSGVSVTVSASSGTLTGTLTKTTAGGTPGLATYGEASFSDLNIPEFGSYTLMAAATPLSVQSRSFEIVADLARCDGAECTNTGRFQSSTVAQVTYGVVNTGADFDKEVVLTTQFLDAAVVSQCVDDDAVFGQATEVRVQDVFANGSGVSATEPAFTVAIIFPKSTLQNLGLASRNADSFNICLGATYLGEPQDFAPWQATATSTDTTLVDAVVGSDGAYWGWVPNCGTVPADNPCVALKTKNANQLQAALGLSKREFTLLGFQSSDLALVVSKPWPWDGKFGAK